MVTNSFFESTNSCIPLCPLCNFLRVSVLNHTFDPTHFNQNATFATHALTSSSQSKKQLPGRSMVPKDQAVILSFQK